VAVFISAGVYTLEKDESLYAPAISSSVVGLVGTGTKGLEDTPVLITNESQLVEVFGRPRAKDYGLQAAIQVLKSIRQLYYVRISGAAASKGTVSVNDVGSDPTPGETPLSTNSGPFNLEPGATIDFTTNPGAAANTATFSATAAQEENVGAGPFDLNGIAAGADVTLTVLIDQESAVQTVTFSSGDALISNFAAVTQAEITAVINDQILGANASVEAGPVVRITSDTRGTGSYVQVTGGTANGVLGWPTSEIQGTGNVATIDAVTAAEVKTIVDAVGGGSVILTTLSGQQVKFATVATGATADIRIEDTSTAIGAAPLVNIPTEVTYTGTAAAVAAARTRFDAATNGSHSSRVSLVISASPALTGARKVIVRLDGIQVEVYDKLSADGLANAYDLLTAINSGTPDGAFPASAYVDATELNAAGGEIALGTFTLTAGLNGDDWVASDVIGAVTAGVSTGLQLFANADVYPITILATPGISYASVIAEGLSLCSTRGDCLFIADAPKGLAPEDAVKWHNGDNSITATVDQELRTEANSTTFNSSYGALYYPFVKIADKFGSNAEILVPPSGMAIRTLGYTDRVAEPWFAPAGPNRTQAADILDVEFQSDQGTRDLMQVSGNNLNPITKTAGIGIEILGQKTLLRTPSALDRINVRRLMLLIEKTIARSVRFLTFEPNDPIMWRRFINLVSPLLDDIKAKRGIVDFRVIADSSTNTATLINQNTFSGKVLLVPTKAAERLIIGFTLLPQGASFEEFAQA
jgi:uncharacterized protein